MPIRLRPVSLGPVWSFATGRKRDQADATRAAAVKDMTSLCDVAGVGVPERTASTG
jgi:hypothetical protein